MTKHHWTRQDLANLPGLCAKAGIEVPAFWKHQNQSTPTVAALSTARSQVDSGSKDPAVIDASIDEICGISLELAVLRAAEKVRAPARGTGSALGFSSGVHFSRIA